jgi:hypothetical protein
MSSIINAVSGGSGGVSVTGDTSGQLVLQTAGTTAVTVNSSQQTTFANTINTPNTFGFKNRIINGAMVIDQRDAGASVTALAIGSYVYTLDRWRYYASAASKYTVQQNAGSVTPPVGFTNYIGITSSSAYSVGSSDTFFLSQVIEGFNIADLGWGTANAKTVTLSFQVYSSLTGTFGGSLRNLDTPNRSYPFSYTVSSANTWTTISVTIAGDTTGTWNTTNGQGIQVQLNLGSGSTFSGTANTWQAGNLIAPTGATSVVGTNGATFYITGVQLETGSTATSFDYRPYGTELALCQRYFQTSYLGSAIGTATTTGQLTYTCSTTFSYNGPTFTLQTPMRTSATITSYSPVTGSSGKAYQSTSSADFSTSVTNGSWSAQIFANNVSLVGGTNITLHYTASAEL